MFMKGSDQVFRYSVDRAAIELLYRPLPAARGVSRARPSSTPSCAGAATPPGRCSPCSPGRSCISAFRSLGVLTMPLILAWLLSARAAQRAYRARLLDDLRAEIPPSGSAERSGPAFAADALLRHVCGGRDARGPRPGSGDTASRSSRAHRQASASVTGTRARQGALPRRWRRRSSGLRSSSTVVRRPARRGADHRDEGRRCHRAHLRGCCACCLPIGIPAALPRRFVPATFRPRHARRRISTRRSRLPHRQFLMPLLDRWALAAASNRRRDGSAGAVQRRGSQALEECWRS